MIFFYENIRKWYTDCVLAAVMAFAMTAVLELQNNHLQLLINLYDEDKRPFYARKPPLP